MFNFAKHFDNVSVNKSAVAMYWHASGLHCRTLI